MIVPGAGVTFFSFDPAGRSILALPFPSDLIIQSRSSGEYSITSLYKLGSYGGSGGMFARQKVQGFMRVPIPGYLVVAKNHGSAKNTLWTGLIMGLFGRGDTSLSRLDTLGLLTQLSQYSYREIGVDELTRAAVLEKQSGQTIYHPERLQVYVGTKFFDWGIGASGMTAAVVNESGVNGLGNDMADFLTNLGFDVVMVRSTATGEARVTSAWQIASDPALRPLPALFASLFGLPAPTMGTDPQYRAQVVVQVGEDAKELF